MKKETIIQLMNDESYNESSFYNAIYFQPTSGMFLYADKYIKSEAIIELIDNKVIENVGTHTHQGELMVKYILI
jgi:hypothetical protein